MTILLFQMQASKLLQLIVLIVWLSADAEKAIHLHVYTSIYFEILDFFIDKAFKLN